MGGLPAVVRLSEGAAHEAVNEIPGQPWMYGVGGFLILLILLYLVTRLNIDR